MIRVTIFEDNALINEGIRMMVESQTDMLMAGAFRDARGVLKSGFGQAEDCRGFDARSIRCAD